MSLVEASCMICGHPGDEHDILDCDCHTRKIARDAKLLIGKTVVAAFVVDDGPTLCLKLMDEKGKYHHIIVATGPFVYDPPCIQKISDEYYDEYAEEAVNVNGSPRE